MKRWMAVTLLFVAVFLIRILISLQTPYLTTGDSYLQLRSAEHILETGMPLMQDALAYGGRVFVHSPIYDYLLAIGGLFMPLTLAAKLLSNLLASALVFPLYFITFHITKKQWPSLVSALLASFVPIFFAHTFNHATPSTLALLLYFVLIYCWFKLPKKQWVYGYLAALVLFALSHPLSLLFALSLLITLILFKLERVKVTSVEIELGLFSIFFILWVQFIIYKDLILYHGLQVFWQNTPSALQHLLITDVSIPGLLWTIGIIPLIFGTYIVYTELAKPSSKHTSMLVSFILVIFTIIWFQIIPFFTALSLLAILLLILFGLWIKHIYEYLRKTKITAHEPALIAAFALLLVSTSIFPAFTESRAQLMQTIDGEQVESFEWIQQNTPETATLLAPIDQGHYITGIAQRKNVIDTYFLLQPHIDERYADVQRMYQTQLITEEIDLLEKYDISHILLPKGVRSPLIEQHRCFENVFNKRIRIYERNLDCTVKVIV